MPLPKYVEKVCRTHGKTSYVLEGRGTYRCRTCRVESVVRRRRKVKAILVEEAGDSCVLCGYDRCIAALEFHHIDKQGKSFSISQMGFTRGLQKQRDEVKKCKLLCANCHREVEAGIVLLISG